MIRSDRRRALLLLANVGLGGQLIVGEHRVAATQGMTRYTRLTYGCLCPTELVESVARLIQARNPPPRSAAAANLSKVGSVGGGRPVDRVARRASRVQQMLRWFGCSVCLKQARHGSLVGTALAVNGAARHSCLLRHGEESGVNTDRKNLHGRGSTVVKNSTLRNLAYSMLRVCMGECCQRRSAALAGSA